MTLATMPAVMLTAEAREYIFGDELTIAMLNVGDVVHRGAKLSGSGDYLVKLKANGWCNANGTVGTSDNNNVSSVFHNAFIYNHEDAGFTDIKDSGKKYYPYCNNRKVSSWVMDSKYDYKASAWSTYKVVVLRGYLPQYTVTVNGVLAANDIVWNKHIVRQRIIAKIVIRVFFISTPPRAFW